MASYNYSSDLPTHGNKQMPPKDFKCYSYSESHVPRKLNKWNSGGDNWKIGSKSSSSKSWSFNDSEFQRKKRVAGYRVYSVEGRVKGSLSKSFRWIKDRYARMVHGGW